MKKYSFIIVLIFMLLLSSCGNKTAYTCPYCGNVIEDYDPAYIYEAFLSAPEMKEYLDEEEIHILYSYEYGDLLGKIEDAYNEGYQAALEENK